MRTMMFVVAAGASVAVAAVTHFASQPNEPEGYEKVGTEFYADFQDPNEATDLRVVSYSEDTADIRTFEVQFKDGLWLIPSHHDYPADGADRLAKTAASIIGIQRGALVSRRESEFGKFGVVDPMSDDMTLLKGRGSRVTLSKGEDQILADYIIGKKGEGDAYYVRTPKEKDTYLCQLKIDLSTKFGDWIEPDLLKVERNKIRRIVVDKYSIDETQGVIKDRETSTLSRTSSTDDWKLDGIDEKSEELKKDEIRDVVSSLDELKLVGVRPKPSGINADLTVDQNVVKDRQMLMALQQEMAIRGFLVSADEKNKPFLVSNEGEISTATEDGVAYHLHFGEIFAGDEQAIEIGAPADEEEGEDADGESDGDAGNDTKDGTSPSSDDDADRKQGLKRSRYLFVTAEFDESLIAAAPEKPIEPQKPEEAGADSTEGESEDEETSDAPEESEEDAESDEAGGDAEKPDTAADEKVDKPDPKAEYEAAVAKYEADLANFNRAVEEREKKIEDGKKTVEELNARFGGWYYVISAESFENLRLARADLVKPKEKTDDESKTEAPSLGTPPGSAPGNNGPSENPPPPKKPEEKTTPPAESNPTSAAPKPPTDSKPAEPESKPDDETAK